jgi:hypothetical protein
MRATPDENGRSVGFSAPALGLRLQPLSALKPDIFTLIHAIHVAHAEGEHPMRLVNTCALAVVLLAGCLAKRDMDECRKGDRSRCPGDASDFYRQRG